MKKRASSERNISEIFGQGMRIIREARGMKQETLAGQAGYRDHSNIAKIETGKSLPSLPKALRLAEILQVPLDTFLRAGRGEDWSKHGSLDAEHHIHTVAAASGSLLAAMESFGRVLASLPITSQKGTKSYSSQKYGTLYQKDHAFASKWHFV